MALPEKLFGMMWEKNIFFFKGEKRIPCFLKAQWLSSNKSDSVPVRCLPLPHKVDVLLWKNRRYFIQELIWID